MSNNTPIRADARSFTWVQRKAIHRLALVAEPIRHMPGVGRTTIDRLIEDGIVMVAGEHRCGETIYKLTDAGERLHATFCQEMLFLRSHRNIPHHPRLSS